MTILRSSSTQSESAPEFLLVAVNSKYGDEEKEKSEQYCRQLLPNQHKLLEMDSKKQSILLMPIKRTGSWKKSCSYKRKTNKKSCGAFNSNAFGGS